jgi:hypothetical protein
MDFDAALELIELFARTGHLCPEKTARAIYKSCANRGDDYESELGDGNEGVVIADAAGNVVSFDRKTCGWKISI